MNEKRISDTTLHVLFSNGAKTVKQPTKISKSDWDYFSSIYVRKSREKRSHGDWSPTGKQHSRRGTCKGPKHRSTFSPVQSALASKLAPLRQRRTQNEFRWKRKKAVRDGLSPNPIVCRNLIGDIALISNPIVCRNLISDLAIISNIVVCRNLIGDIAIISNCIVCRGLKISSWNDIKEIIAINENHRHYENTNYFVKLKKHQKSFYKNNFSRKFKKRQESTKFSVKFKKHPTYILFNHCHLICHSSWTGRIQISL